MKQIVEIRTCYRHGETEYFIVARSGGGVKRQCKKCTNDRFKEFRRKNKAILVAEFGGKCQRCPYNKYQGALQFHHKNPKEKIKGIAFLINSLEKAREEAKKCILVCANCHFELEAIEKGIII